MGYITETEKNFELDMEVTCESEFGYLQDRDCRVENKFYTASGTAGTGADRGG